MRDDRDALSSDEPPATKSIYVRMQVILTAYLATALPVGLDRLFFGAPSSDPPTARPLVALGLLVLCEFAAGAFIGWRADVSVGIGAATVFLALLAVLIPLQILHPGDPGEVHSGQPDQLAIIVLASAALTTLWSLGAVVGRRSGRTQTSGS